MAKLLKDILKQAHDTIKGVRGSTTEPASTGKDPGVDYKPKSGDESDFIAKHSVQKWDDPAGNPNFADKVKHTLASPEEKRHGNTQSKAKAANEEVQIHERNTANKMKKDAAVTAVGSKNRDDQHLGSRGMKTSVADKIRGREKMSGNDRKQFEEVEQIDELSSATKKAYVAAATDDKKEAERQANHSEYTAKHAKTAKQKSDFSKEAEWLKSIAAKRAKGIKMATKEETDPGFVREDWTVTHADGSVTKHDGARDALKASRNSPGSKVGATHGAMGQKAADVLGTHQKANLGTFTAGGYTPPEKKKKIKEEVEDIQELSTDLLHRAAHKAAKKAMSDVQGRFGPIFKKRAAQANKFRAKGMEQEKKEKAAAVKEEVVDEAMGYTSQKELARRAASYKKFNSPSAKAAQEKRIAAHMAAQKGRNANDKEKDVKEETLDEKHLTPAEMKKREEVAQAIHKKDPSMSMDKKMAIATSTAKKATKISNYRADRDKHMEEDLAVPLLGGGQKDDESAEMAKAELKAIANQAMHLVMQIPDTMIIEPWVQSKIAQAKVMISGVHDYMVYGDHDKPEEDEQMDTPITFPNMSVDVNTGQNV